MDADNMSGTFGDALNTTGTMGTSGTAGATGATGASGAQGETGNRAQGIADLARNAASQAKTKAGEQVQSSIDKGRSRAADTLQDVARSLLGTANGETVAQPYMTRAGEQVQRAADYLQNTELTDMVADTESFARRQPALFLGGAFALGVLAARFLKSSRPNTGEGQWDASGSTGRLYDRETALTPYREPSDYSASGSMGTTGSTGAMGNAALGDDELDWPSGMGDIDGGTSSTDVGTRNTR